MVGSDLLASRRPCHADALNDRSWMPPVSVTTHATNVAALAIVEDVVDADPAAAGTTLHKARAVTKLTSQRALASRIVSGAPGTAPALLSTPDESCSRILSVPPHRTASGGPDSHPDLVGPCLSCAPRQR